MTQGLAHGLSDDFHVYDTTLRDGAQREGISYSVADKLHVAKLLDGLGVGFIEGGWPGALPKDTEFFQRAANELDLTYAQLAAFGSTRKAGVAVEDDAQVAALLDSQAPIVTLVAKSDIAHVEQALRTTLDENIAMVVDTVSYLVSQGRRVFLDLEHFFDGYLRDPNYGVTLLQEAFKAGADVGVLCDTNGGMLPSKLGAIVADVRERATGAAAGGKGRLGIHCQDDTACAVANTMAAVESGAMHVQCTANGYGERAGNADLFTVIGNLQLKMGKPVLPEGKIVEMSRVSHAIAEIANLQPDSHQAYVGASAFAHKAGLHASALRVNADLYNHIDPAVVGNDMRVLVTEMAGRASVELKAKELGYDLTDRDELGRVVSRVKELEAQGWSFEAADASFELLLRGREETEQYFQVESWRCIVEQRPDGEVVSEATVKVHAKGQRIISTGEGVGPVNALDNALRSAVTQLYPEIDELELTDYKVRILEEVPGTAAITRTLVEMGNGDELWTTVGVHDNVIAASWRAMADGVIYGLWKSEATQN